jgi:toxin ParE1/3/4
MSWKIETRPELEDELVEAAAWYEKLQAGLGDDFLDAVQKVRLSFADNPYLNSRRLRLEPVHWRLTKRFPYRVVYEVFETQKLVVIISVLHAARHDNAWRKRLI